MIYPTWFLGEVVDVSGDPEKLGRVRVKVYQMHDTGIKNEDLLWSHIMMPNTSASFGGIGDTPSLVKGSRVVGIFVDGDQRRVPMVIGTMLFNPSTDSGSSDHSLSFMARGQNAIEKEKIGSEEPDSAFKASYSDNRVIQTKTGHVIEIDDTNGNERIHIYHRTGTYAEINKDGRLVVGVRDDFHENVAGDKIVEVKGNVRISVDGNANIGAKGDITVASEGDLYMGAKGTVTIDGVKGVNIRSTKTIVQQSPGGVYVDGSLTVSGALSSASAATGSFSTPSGKNVEVSKGIVTQIRE